MGLYYKFISVYDDSIQMRILAGGTVAFVCILVLGMFEFVLGFESIQTNLLKWDCFFYF